jgi:hypothetical protein
MSDKLSDTVTFKSAIATLGLQAKILLAQQLTGEGGMDLLMATKAVSGASMRPDKEYVTVDEAEEISSVSKWFWRRAAYAGAIESVKVGRRLIIPLGEVKRVLSEGKRPRLPGATFCPAKTA